MIDPSSPEALERHLTSYYGPGGFYPHAGEEPCICPHTYKSLGRLFGVTMGKSWLRASTDPGCLHHGDRDQAERRAKRKAKT